jgi:hypothetical protein
MNCFIVYKSWSMRMKKEKKKGILPGYALWIVICPPLTTVLGFGSSGVPRLLSKTIPSVLSLSKISS